MEELVVWHWKPEKSVGMARPLVRQRGDEDDIFFGNRDIVTLGEETLKCGSRIRARLVPDLMKPGRMKAVDVEIYVTQPEDDANFVASMRRAKGLKRYQTENA